MVVIATYTPPELRYQRISKRVLDIKDTKLRNRPFTVAEAKSRDFSQIENLEIGGTIAMADYTILNIKDNNFLTKQIEEIFKDIEGK